jgi:hypothetical protein
VRQSDLGFHKPSTGGYRGETSLPQHKLQANASVGSKAEKLRLSTKFSLYPEGRHQVDERRCPLSATRRHMHHSKTAATPLPPAREY